VARQPGLETHRKVGLRLGTPGGPGRPERVVEAEGGREQRVVAEVLLMLSSPSQVGGARRAALAQR
jgi:hypothetical protein